MHKIYNKKLQNDRANLRLSLLRSNILILIMQTVTNFTLILRFKPIT